MRKLTNSATQKLLIEVRTRLGLTTAYQLGQALGWPGNYIYRYENGEITMGPSTMLDFAAKTNTPIADVVAAAAADEQARKLNQTSGKALAA